MPAPIRVRLAGLVLCALALELAAPSAGVRAPSPAGLVLVTVDTLRADEVGAYGGPAASPSLDALAAQGALVEQAFTPTPSTGPAHASALTGLHPWRHGVLDNGVPLGAGPPTLAQILRDQGFATAAFVSSYILHPRFAFDRGFDIYEFVANRDYTWRGRRRTGFWGRGAETTARAMTWLTSQASSGGRFFLWVHYFDPHTPYAPPAGYALSPDAPVDLDGKSVPPGVQGPRQLERLVRAYRGEVHYADAQIGRLLDRVHMLGLDDRTVVIVTSDHGEGLGDHGVLEHGSNVYDELVRVPLVVRAPGVPAGSRPAGLAQLEDLLPTALSLLGLPASTPEAAAIDGLDLAPWLRGATASSPREVVLGRRKQLRGRPDLYFAREHDRKWIGRLDTPGVLHDLARDAGERTPQPGGGAPGVLVSRLAVGTTGQASESAAATRGVDPEVREALEALGYVD